MDKYSYIEAEKTHLKEELEQARSQVSQYKAVCESQETALREKDGLLEQFKQVNESLQNDLTALKDLNSQRPSKKTSTVAAYPGGSYNPWSDSSQIGSEPEQYRKMFVGGLSYDTTDDTLRQHFEEYGEVERAAIMKDANKQSRGFGFVVFKTAAMIDNAQLNRPHVIDGRSVDTKRALPKEDTDKPENSARVKKLFVGGMNRDTSEEQVKEYFETFGEVESVEMLVYRDTGKRRGFAFVFFTDFDVVDKLVLIKHHLINGTKVEVKKAVSKEAMNRNRFGSDRDMRDGGGADRGGNNSGYWAGLPSNNASSSSNNTRRDYQQNSNRGDYNQNRGDFSQNQNSGEYSQQQGASNTGNRTDYPPDGNRNSYPPGPDISSLQNAMQAWANYFAFAGGNGGNGGNTQPGGGPMRNNASSHRSGTPYGNPNQQQQGNDSFMPMPPPLP